MRIGVTKFTIITKKRPTGVYYSDGQFGEFLEDAFLFEFRQNCEDTLKTFDTPDDYEVAEVNIWMEV